MHRLSFSSLLAHLREAQKIPVPKIGSLALTNTDTAHLRLLLDSGFDIVSNQVACSVLDRRILKKGGMAELCHERGVGILA